MKKPGVPALIPTVAFLFFTIAFECSSRAEIVKGPLLFQDDFSEGTDRWIDGEKGAVRDGWYTLRGEQGVEHRVAVRGSEAWTDYIVEFDVRIENIAANWIVRCDLRPRHSRYYLFCFDGRELERNIKLDKNHPAGETRVRKPVKHGLPHHVTIVAKGSVIKQYIDGELVDTFTDDSLAKGGFGFRQMNHEKGAFANVKIHALPKDVVASNPSRQENILSPLASIPFAMDLPHIDGKIGQDEWSGAARLTGFTDLGGKLARKQTSVVTLWDNENLYFGFESRKLFERNVPRKPRDSKDLFGYDAIEISLKPGDDEWMKLVFDSVGSKWDARFKDRSITRESWDPEWIVENHTINDVFYVGDIWQAEVVIPFASLGVDPPVPVSEWAVQICRDFDVRKDLNYPMPQRWTSWSPASEGGFNEPKTFGTFRFVKDAPAFRLLAYADIENGRAGLRGEVVASGPADFVLALQAWLAGDKETLLLDREFPLASAGGQTPIPVAADDALDVAEITDVEISWALLEKNSSTAIARGAVRSECVPSFAVNYAPLFTRETILIDGDLSRMRDLPAEIEVNVEVHDAEGSVLGTSEHHLPADEDTFLARHSLEGVSPGSHTITVTLADANGGLVASSTRALEVPAEPEWMQREAGALTGVPSPWTPVELERDQDATIVKTWSKAYRYENGILPDQITIRGEDRLGAPVALVLVSDRGREEVRFNEPAVSETSGLGTTLRWRGESDQFEVESKARIEFDGLIWNETRIRPRSGEAIIREAYLEIPLKKRGLRYMRGEDSMNFLQSHAYIAMIAEGKLARDYPPPHENPNFSVKGWPWQDRFINFYWAGGVDFGLFVVLPSLRGTSISKKYNDLIEEDDRCMFRLYFIDQPTRITDGRAFEYGLIGTPTRPMRDRGQMNRTGYIGIKELSWDHLMHEISREWDGGVIDKFFTGQRTEVEKGDFYAKTFRAGLFVSRGNAQPNAEEMKLIQDGVRSTRDLGAKPLLWLDLTYTPISLAHAKPYEIEWEQFPSQRSACGGEECILVCPKSRSWRNYYLGNLDRLMKEEGISGVYLDLTGPGSCNNHYHGCGYEEDGERKGEIPFLELRDLFLRLYNVVHSNDPDGVIFYHSNSWNPTVLYADMDTKGEGWARADDYRTFSLPYYQAGYMFQHQYNIAHNFFATHIYCNYRGTPERVATLAECVGMSLLHDTLPCACTSLEVAGLLTVWNALDDFGAYDPGTEWTPYWESGLGDWQDGAAVSTYRHPGGNSLLVIFNPQFDATHSLDLALSDFNAASAYEVITGERSDDAEMHIDLPPRELKLLRLDTR